MTQLDELELKYKLDLQLKGIIKVELVISWGSWGSMFLTRMFFYSIKLLMMMALKLTKDLMYQVPGPAPALDT